MTENVLSPWRKYFVQTLAVWGICCVLVAMLLDGDRGNVVYAVGSLIFWNVVAACSIFRRKPSAPEGLIYRIGPVILFVIAMIADR